MTLFPSHTQAICETYLYLGHTAHVHRMAAVIKGEAAQVKDVWCLLAVQGYDTAGKHRKSACLPRPLTPSATPHSFARML